jgi:D-glycero-alpha-D-manno-heptose-7-phosphate kinase
MILTRTPVRVSLLGGGTDYPDWFLQHNGVVVGGAVNHYSYVTARFLPPFHDFRHRLVYRDIEAVGSIGDIRHAAIKAVLQRLNWDDNVGVEIAHLSDLPSRSGTGSSSTFVVGLLHALYALQGRLRLPHELAAEAIAVEQKDLGETVGCQDQTWAAHGGVNVIWFQQNGDINATPLSLSAEHVAELENHLMLFFTKLPRTSSEVAASYAATLGERQREQYALMKMAEEGIMAIYARRWERLGKLIDQSWRVKAGLSPKVTNPAIDRLYATARVCGAWGGKLTGAGGGGCMLLVAPPDKQPAILAGLKDAVHVPFKFDFSGSSVVFSCPHNIREYRK